MARYPQRASTLRSAVTPSGTLGGPPASSSVGQIFRLVHTRPKQLSNILSTLISDKRYHTCQIDQ